MLEQLKNEIDTILESNGEILLFKILTNIEDDKVSIIIQQNPKFIEVSNLLIDNLKKMWNIILKNMDIKRLGKKLEESFDDYIESALIVIDKKNDYINMSVAINDKYNELTNKNLNEIMENTIKNNATFLEEFGELIYSYIENNDDNSLKNIISKIKGNDKELKYYEFIFRKIDGIWAYDNFIRKLGNIKEQKKEVINILNSNNINILLNVVNKIEENSNNKPIILGFNYDGVNISNIKCYK